MITYSIGIPKEIKTNELRVSLVPREVKKLTSLNFKVFVQKNAGIGANFYDEDYINAGAIICQSAKDVFDNADIIIKVKEILKDEYYFIKSNHIILTFFHFASNPDLINFMISSKSTCIAYETIMKNDGSFPILAPMSIIAGEQSIINASYHINNMNCISNESYDFTNDIITIIGVGNVGKASAYKAKDLGYKHIHLIDKDIQKLHNFVNDGFYIHEMNISNLTNLIKISTIIIGSIYNSGEKASKLITNDLLELVKENSIIMDVAIDQGGITDQSIPTTIYNPIIKYNKANIYCVPNIPTLVPYKASIDLSKAIFPYLEEILKDNNILFTIHKNDELKRGVNIINGELWNKNLINSI